MPKRDPVAEVFAIPELVSLIVHHCFADLWPPEYHTNHVGLVARAWLGPATSITWRSSTLQRLFAPTIDVSRRQYYADRVRYLRVIYPQHMDDQLPHVSFRNLESLLIADSINAGTEHVLPSPVLWKERLLGPRLTSLRLASYEMITPDLPDYIERRCPSLESLHIASQPESQECVDVLTRAVQVLPRLRKLTFNTDNSTLGTTLATTSTLAQLSTGDLFPSIATLRHLESLRCGEIVPDLTCVRSQLPRLETFHAKVSNEGFRLVGPLMPHLVELDLALPSRDPSGPPTPILSPLSPLSSLKRLTLRIAGNAVVEAADFSSLTNLQNLKHLYIGKRNVRDRLPAPEITNELLSRTIQHLPLLVEFHAQLQHASGSESLLTFSTHCPRLRFLWFPGHYDLHTLRKSGEQFPAFPNLEAMYVTSLFFKHPRAAGETPRRDFENMLQTLATHFPKLTHVGLEGQYCQLGIRLTACLKKQDPHLICTCDGLVGSHTHLDHMLGNDDERVQPPTTSVSGS